VTNCSTAPLSLEPSVDLHQQVSPELCLFTRLLALPSVELMEVIDEELCENPALRRRDSSRCPNCGWPVNGRCRRCWSSTRLDAPRALADVPAPVDVIETVLADTAGVLREEDRAVCAFVLADLDGRGFLDRDLTDLAHDLGVDEGRVGEVISLLRRIAEPGLASPDVRSCLLQQLHVLEQCDGPQPVVRVLIHHLGELAIHGLPNLAERHGIPLEELAAALAYVQTRLHPYAALPSASRSSPPPPPDVEIIEAGGGRFVGQVVEDPRPWLVVDRVYRDLARRGGTPRRGAGPQDCRIARDAVARANRFLEQLDRRCSTLEAVTTAAANHQCDFLRMGPAGHRPLTRAALATEIGVHESTVSRAVKDKVVRIPNGRALPLAALFGGSVAVRESLRDLLLRTEGRRPPTDGVLAEQLRERGFDVARRTVAKYRIELVGVQDGRTEQRSR
jgi:RNA polymerase sigma-54 factor